MKLHQHLLCILSIYLLLFVILLGNSSCSSSHLGIRPDPPDPPTKNKETVDDYYIKLNSWGKELSLSYDSRASANRFALITGGAIALAGATALGIYNGRDEVSSSTNVRITLGTGFLTGLLALFDNKTLAGIYTDGANNIRSKLSEIAVKRSQLNSKKEELNEELYKGILEIVSKVEKSRTDLSRGMALPCVVEINKPSSGSVQKATSFTFTATGQKGSIMWSISKNRSGGTIDSSGLYKAGPNPNETDSIMAVDLGGCLPSSIEVLVTP